MKPIAMLLLLGLLGGCAATDETTDTAPAVAEPPKPQAHARLRDAKGQPAGTATFTEAGDAVKFELTALGLSPGRHGVHIHEAGKCEGPGFKSAGGHFNPHQRQHGLQNPKGAHAGDLPNLVASEDGMASALATLTGVTLAQGGPHSLLDADGAAVVVHAKADDDKTDPAGNSGDRVACGVIVPGAP